MIGFLVSVALIALAILAVNAFLSSKPRAKPRMKYDFDAIIVGGSIAGPVMAKALSDQGRKVLVVDRTLFTRPDRIVGELLQPGGINALKEVGMESCATSIGMPCKGYLVVDRDGKLVDLPYGHSAVGVSFHFGDFVQKLRSFVFNNCQENVVMVEGTVTQVLTERAGLHERAYGIEYQVATNYTVPPKPFEVDPVKPAGSVATELKRATAPVVIMCDGGMSKWKGRFQHYTPASDYHSNFIGIVLKTVRLPVEQRGTVFFGKTGPILSYRLDDNELRMLVDYNRPSLPPLEKQSEWLLREVAPCLPEAMRAEFIRVSSNTNNLRSMAVARYPPTFPLIKGYVGIGDHGNQRHPLTGGGMTCAFRDALRLANNLSAIYNLRPENEEAMANTECLIQEAILKYTRHRYSHSCCINLLSWALYDVFSLGPLRDACFQYFECGGKCVAGPMDLLAGMDPSVLNLVLHYYSVMLHGVWNIVIGVTTGKSSSTAPNKVKSMITFFADPKRLAKAGYLLVKSTLVVLPIAKNEFFSIWRFIDPTSPVAVYSKKVKSAVYLSCFKGKDRKPVGL